jgi:hypothetical protein
MCKKPYKEQDGEFICKNYDVVQEANKEWTYINFFDVFQKTKGYLTLEMSLLVLDALLIYHNRTIHKNKIMKFMLQIDNNQFLFSTKFFKSTTLYFFFNLHAQNPNNNLACILELLKKVFSKQDFHV